MIVKLISCTPCPEELLTEILSVVRKSRANPKDIDEILSQHHFSPLEFIVYVFEVDKTSIACMRQSQRHRIGSYIEVSQRWTDCSHIPVVHPETVSRVPEALEIFDGAVGAIQDAYAKLVKLGIPGEDARYLLPIGTETTCFVKYNLRSLINFANERLCAHAQWEVRAIAEAMVRLVVKTNPRMARVLVPKCELYGKCFEKNPCQEVID